MNFATIKTWIKGHLTMSIYFLIAFVCLVFTSIVALISFFPWALIPLIAVLAGVVTIAVLWIRNESALFEMILGALLTLVILLAGVTIILLGAGVAHF